jgi:hypothetical protein
LSLPVSSPARLRLSHWTLMLTLTAQKPITTADPRQGEGAAASAGEPPRLAKSHARTRAEQEPLRRLSGSDCIAETTTREMSTAKCECAFSKSYGGQALLYARPRVMQLE